MAIKKHKRISLFILSILSFLIVCCLMYFRPMFINNNIKNEATNCINKINFDVITDNVLTEECYYLDSDDDFDYFYMTEYSKDGSTIVSTSLLKLKNDTIIGKYNLSNLGYTAFLHVERGICDGSYLYFIVRGINSVYRIDCNFTICEQYIKSCTYGSIAYSSLCLYGDSLMYITDNGSIIRYQNGKEDLFATVPSIETKFSNTAIDFNEFLIQYNDAKTTNYLICSDGSKTFYAAKNKLFLYKDGQNKEVRIHLPKHSYVQKLCFSKENENLLFVYYQENIGPWEGKTNHLIILNTKTGGMRKFDQIPEHHSREWETPGLEFKTGDLLV